MNKIEKALLDKLKEHKNCSRKNCQINVFKKRYYIGPENIKITNYLRTRPIAIFNPGAVLNGKKLHIFPRLIFDYYKYTSSIGVFSLDVEELLRGETSKNIETEIILWPQQLWEFLGCEDARVTIHKDSYYLLYTGKGYYYGEKNELLRRDVLGFAELDQNYTPKRKGYFSIEDEGESFLPKTTKDSAFIKITGNNASMLTRFEVGNTLACWHASGNLESLAFNIEDIEPVLLPESWEHKVGWSTNTVKLSDDEYLVGWHAVLKENLSYRNGLALVDGNGKLKAVSDYLLTPIGLNEEYGDRAMVIFGDGLIIYQDKLLWIGGVSDYCIGIFIARLEDIMKELIFCNR